MKILVLHPIQGGRKPSKDNRLIADREQWNPGDEVDFDDATALSFVSRGFAVALDELPVDAIDAMFRDAFRYRQGYAAMVGDLDVINLKRDHVLATVSGGEYRIN